MLAKRFLGRRRNEVWTKSKTKTNEFDQKIKRRKGLFVGNR